MKDDKTPFFVGYLPPPGPLRPFLIVAMVAFIAIFVAGGYFLGTSQDAPEEARFRFDIGRQTLTGTIEMTPYPVLHVTEGSEAIPAGRTMMLAGQGKNGVDPRLVEMAGLQVTVSGVAMQRGTIDMLQLRGGQRGLMMAEGDPITPEITPLGRWRLAGEICDGKCLYGAMRPGRGLAHKACAALCLDGGIPPVFVSTQPVEGSEFMLVTGPDGAPMPDAAYDRIGQFISVEGALSRHGDLLVFAIDAETMDVIDG